MIMPSRLCQIKPSLDQAHLLDTILSSSSTLLSTTKGPPCPRRFMIVPFLTLLSPASSFDSLLHRPLLYDDTYNGKFLTKLFAHLSEIANS